MPKVRAQRRIGDNQIYPIGCEEFICYRAKRLIKSQVADSGQVLSMISQDLFEDLEVIVCIGTIFSFILVYNGQLQIISKRKINHFIEHMDVTKGECGENGNMIQVTVAIVAWYNDD